MNQLKIFENPEFGKIRTITEDGKTLFCGSDVAKALGYARPNEAVSKHCKGTLKRCTPTKGGIQEMLFIPEGDVYRLAARSELPGAERFESWIFDEVVPTIRKTGTYSLTQNQKDYPVKSTSVGEVAQLLKVLRLIMRENNQPPEAISKMAEGICGQFGIILPTDFVKVDIFELNQVRINLVLP